MGYGIQISRVSAEVNVSRTPAQSAPLCVLDCRGIVQAVGMRGNTEAARMQFFDLCAVTSKSIIALGGSEGAGWLAGRNAEREFHLSFKMSRNDVNKCSGIA